MLRLKLEPVHIELKFNGMLMSVCDTVGECHPSSKFWMPWGKWPQLEMFLKMNKIEKVQDKKVFGILVAHSIIGIVPAN